MTNPRILVVSDDDFTTSYVTAALAERDLAVVHRSGAAMAVMLTEGIPERFDAAVVVPRRLGLHTEDHAAWLRGQGIPYLLILSPAAAKRRDLDVPLLAEPFAAYQVADWAQQAITQARTPEPASTMQTSIDPTD